MSIAVVAKDASLTSLQVTITALMVSGKQMTLAVFRQLPVKDAIIQSGALDPTLDWWGLVRYSIKDEGELWVVAEAGGILYRCPMPHPRHLWNPHSNALHDAQRDLKGRYLKERERALANVTELTALYDAWEATVRVAAKDSADSLSLLPQLFIAV